MNLKHPLIVIMFLATTSLFAADVDAVVMQPPSTSDGIVAVQQNVQPLWMPTELYRLTCLTHFDLSHNNLTELPTEISSLIQLTNFDLSWNQLTALPPQIGALTQLTNLNLSGNQLTQLPPQIGALTQLTDLALSYNELTALPLQIGRLTQLTDLSLDSNQLISIPGSIENIQTLVWIDLRNNPLESIGLWEHFGRQDLLKRAISLPESVDLRKYCPEVFDQGNMDSCAVQAVIGAIEIAHKKRGDHNNPPLSRLFLYYNARKTQGKTQEDDGTNMPASIQSIFHEGVCYEKSWPYIDDQKQFKKEPPAKCYQEAIANKALLDLDLFLVKQNLVTIKCVLASEKPIVFSISVFASFSSDKVRKTGIIPLPKPDEQRIEEHALILVGYDDAQQKFLVRNSWGKDWGQKGYGWIAYDHVINSVFAQDFLCFFCESAKTTSSSSSTGIDIAAVIAA